MPTYEYKCHICGEWFEANQPAGKRDCATCPACSCRADKKLSVFNWSVGFILSDESRYIPYRKDELVRNI